MEEKITKEIAQEIMKTRGEIRGMAMKGYANFILYKEGKEGLKKVEEKMASLGCDVKYGEVKTMKLYPIGLEKVALTVLEELFNYNDEFYEMGKFVSKLPLVIRLFLKYLGSIEMIKNEVSRMWERYYTVGRLTVVEYDKDKKILIGRLENFDLCPSHCKIAVGYFSSMLQFIVKQAVICEEVKCIYKGDKYHEFLLTW